MILLLLWVAAYLLVLAWPKLFGPRVPKPTEWVVWYDVRFNPIGPALKRHQVVLAYDSHEAERILAAYLLDSLQGERYADTRVSITAVHDAKELPPA
jgi:hypothetical protein